MDITRVPRLEDERFNRYIEEHRSFLSKIYPFLCESDYHKEAIEIRPVQRQDKYLRSLNLWRLDDKGLEQHKKFFEKVNGEAFCIYYSGYTLDYQKETFKPDGSPREKGKINNDNAIYTQILPMDFDGIGLNEFEDEIKKINELGIETINIFTGNGFQVLILLDEPCYDLQLFNKFTNLLLSKGFKVDPSIIDSARVLRLPFTFNCKEYDKNKYNVVKPTAKATTIFANTDTRYSLDFVFERIGSLKTVDTQKYNSVKADISTLKMDKHTNTPKRVEKVNRGENKGEYDSFERIGNEYNMINFESLPEPLQKLLTDAPESYRNDGYLFMIPFLRNKLGFSKETIIEVLRIWATTYCNPTLGEDFITKEVHRVWSYNYNGGKWTNALAKKYGYIEFDEYRKKDEIMIPNVFFNNYHLLHNSAIRIFLMMKLFEDRNNIYEWNIELIAKLSRVSDKTVKRYLKQLVGLDLIDKSRGNRKLGIGDKYYISVFWDKSQGYTKFNPYTLESMIYSELDTLIDCEITLYTYIYFMVNGMKDKKCSAGQTYLGNKIGLTRNRVSEVTDSLVTKNRLHKTTKIGTDGLCHCTYYIRG